MSASLLSSGRYLAVLALLAWEQEQLPAELALERVCANVSPRERALTHELLMGVLRWRSRLDALLTRLLSKPLQALPLPVLTVLRLGIYQLRATRMPPHAVVQTTVELCRLVKNPWATGLVNGVLRQYQRNQASLEAEPRGDSPEALAERHAHPAWLVRQLQRLVPAEAGGLEALLQANNQVPPLTLRANASRITRAELLERFQAEGVQAEATAYASGGLTVLEGGNPSQLPGFQAGLFAVQDEASQLVAELLPVTPGMHVLDACAAPGGKTGALASAVGREGRVVATDSSAARLKQVEEMVQRLQPGPVEVKSHDWTQPPPSHWREAFDAVLLDAPCSGFGVLRRVPEIKWRRGLADLPRFGTRQRQLLTHVGATLKRGGFLVYSVCTPLQNEAEDVVAEFLREHAEYQRLPLQSTRWAHQIPSLITEAGELRTWPHRDRADAFFAALLTRV